MTEQPRRRRLPELFGVAVLSAALASGGTYAVTQGADSPAPAQSTTTQQTATDGSVTSPIVQGADGGIDDEQDHIGRAGGGRGRGGDRGGAVPGIGLPATG
ncbi:MAG: hypothetical protein LOY01_14005, partial [Brachybacterium paraconglomeratum]|nr:hypothetical protein [Brachybacterium paraconglomeratum]